MNSRWIIALLSVAAATVLSLTTGPAAATAEVGPSAGTSGTTLEVWQHADFTGDYSQRPVDEDTYHGKFMNNGFQLWDSISSLKTNFQNYKLCLDHFHGRCDASYNAFQNISYVGNGFNDQFSSHFHF